MKKKNSLFNIFKKNTKSLTQIKSVSVDDINRNEFLYYKKNRIPLLIKNGARDWPILEKWNKEYILDNVGTYKCTVVKDSRPAFSKETSTLLSYFNELENVSTLTLDDNPSKAPFFFRDITFPNSFFKMKDIHRFFFFHSVENAGTLPHIHGDALNILQSGRKRWVMFDADKNDNPKGYEILMKNFQNYPPGTHAKKWFSKEPKKIQSKGIIVSEIIQEKGDIVFIPKRFSHAVLNTSKEVMGLVVELNL